ncbi:MAG: glycosyltransferase [Candidatus Sumerlaeia bacterium]
MSKLLIIGMGPLIDKGVRDMGAQCLRTWCFVEPLLKDGHEIRLITLPNSDDPSDPGMKRTALARYQIEGFEYQGFTNSNFDFIHETLRQVARSFLPDAIIGVGNLCAWCAAQIPLPVPLWADMYGYQMTEKQSQANRIKDDSVLHAAWVKETSTARRADKFSASSLPHQYALLGEMASLGRLNQHTFHYHFVHHFPAAYHSSFAEKRPDDAEPVLRGSEVPEDAFVLLWSGGYNYWTDPDFLFEYVDAVLSANANVHYVSTGGAIAGYNTKTYRIFRENVQKSKHRDRYHLLGWVPAEQLPAIYSESNLAINIDEPNYETLFGARTRINNLMASGTPVLTTLGAEISYLVDDANCGIVVPPGNLDALVQATLNAVDTPRTLCEMGERGRNLALAEWSPEHIIKPMRDWVGDPRLSPDNNEKLKKYPKIMNFLAAGTNELEWTSAHIERHNVMEMRQAQIDYEIISRKWWYRTLRFMFGW